jgi:hypothetical protein
MLRPDQLSVVFLCIGSRALLTLARVRAKNDPTDLAYRIRERSHSLPARAAASRADFGGVADLCRNGKTETKTEASTSSHG